MRIFELPADPAFWQDPAPFFQSVLAVGDGLFASSSGLFVLGYEALFALGRDPRVDGHPFPAEGFGPDRTDIYALLRWGLFALAGPEHRGLRQAVIAGLSAQGIGALRPTIRRAISMAAPSNDRWGSTPPGQRHGTSPSASAAMAASADSSLRCSPKRRHALCCSMADRRWSKWANQGSCRASHA